MTTKHAQHEKQLNFVPYSILCDEVQSYISEITYDTERTDEMYKLTLSDETYISIHFAGH